MPATNPRIHVVLEKSLYKQVESMAKKEGISLSLKVRDLVKVALEKYEDLELLRFARERAKTFDRTHALSHEQVWSQTKKRK